MSFEIIQLVEVDSTQDEVLRRIRARAPRDLVVMADHQTKGRGRRAREWESPVGNLYVTVSLSLGSKDRSGDFAFISALALYDAVTGMAHDSDALKLKWPNDLMINGLKCAGILLECPDPDLMLIGLGVNILHAPEGRAKLADRGVTPTPRALLDSFLMALSGRLAQYREQGLAAILSDWQARAMGVGQAITVNLPSITKTGVFAGVNADGALILRHPNGETEVIHTGDVFFGV